MNIDNAETNLRYCGQVLEEEGKLGARRSPALLPTSKQQILDAIGILTAQLYYQGLDDEESLRPMQRRDIFQIVERFRGHSEAEYRAAALFDGLIPRATVQALSASALAWAAAARLLEGSLPEEALDEGSSGRGERHQFTG